MPTSDAKSRPLFLKLNNMVKTTLQKAEAFIRGFEDDETQEGIPELLKEIRDAMSDDYIYSSWCIEDVIEHGKQMGGKYRRISKKAARDILAALEDDHDANIGINWDAIAYQIEKHFGEWD